MLTVLLLACTPGCLFSSKTVDWVDLTPPPQPGARAYGVPIEADSFGMQWEALVARNDVVTFNSRSGADALSELAREQLAGSRRVLALVALGASGRKESAAILLEASREPDTLAGRAAMLGLGESGLVTLDLLKIWMENPNADVRETALLAGLLGGEPSATVLADRIAAEPTHAMHESARRIASFIKEAATSESSDAVRWYLDMRFEAARLYGLIEGDSWSAIMLKRVVEEESFLDDVILPASANLLAVGVKDHLMHALLEGQGPARVGAAVAAMPAEVNSLFEHELWEPQTAEEWDSLLDAIWEDHLQSQVGSILVRALDLPEQNRRAAASVARLEDKAISDVLRPAVIVTEGTTDEDRRWILEFLVSAGGDEAADDIRPFLEDSSRAVRAKAHVALLRIGAGGAEADVTELFTEPGRSDRDSVLIELCAQTHSSYVWKLLHEILALEVLGLEQRIRVGANLILTGRSGPQLSFSDDVRSLPIAGELGALALSALGARGLTEDLEFLVDHFPTEGDRAVNLSVARTLVDRGMPEALPLLQTAMWRGPWDRSILACALLVERFSFRTLEDELERPPAEATSKDLRRVGFALGEWGGLEKAEAFARQLRTGTGDPILQGALLGALSARTH